MLDLLERLRRFDADRASMEDLLLMSAVAKLFLAEHAQHDVEPEDWISDRIRSLTRAIDARNHDDLERQLRQAVATREQAMTPQEKRDAADQKIQTLRKKLGIAPEPATTTT